MKVLTSCEAGEGYEFRSVTPVRDKIEMSSESDLYARLPLGVASLKGELAKAERLELDYVVVGQREATKPPAMLRGDCQGATHYVRSIMVGAYGLNSIGSAKIGASAVIGDIGAQGDLSREVRRLRGSGDVEACATGESSDANCGAVLQLGLQPLMAASGGAVTTAGFGEGLGAVAVVPEIGELRTLPTGAGGLADADVALLELLQEARRTDKSDFAPLTKAAAWAKLAAYSGNNPYRDLAREREEAWKRVHEAEERRREQVARVCAQYKRDTEKLERLLALDDDVVTPKQKAAYQAELKQVYAPFANVLEECVRGNCPKGMVFVPGGTFQMGSNDGNANEKPVHAVTVQDFCMDVTEVTVAAYLECVRTGRCTPAETVNYNGYNESDVKLWNKHCNAKLSDRQNHPINCVDWNQATAYCQAVGKRLPTEEEWEYAARNGSEQRTYVWGNEPPGPFVNACGSECGALGSRLGRTWKLAYDANDGWPTTAPVGSFPRDRTPHGLFDMAGNVWEWTSSGWSEDYEKERSNDRRTNRGGGWLNTAENLRATYRNWSGPARRDVYIGFRCAKTP